MCACACVYVRVCVRACACVFGRVVVQFSNARQDGNDYLQADGGSSPYFSHNPDLLNIHLERKKCFGSHYTVAP